jgi:hypothetical protein
LPILFTPRTQANFAVGQCHRGAHRQQMLRVRMCIGESGGHKENTSSRENLVRFTFDFRPVGHRVPIDAQGQQQTSAGSSRRMVRLGLLVLRLYRVSRQ